MPKHTRIYTRTGDDGNDGPDRRRADQQERSTHRSVRYRRRALEHHRRRPGGAASVAGERRTRGPARRMARLDARRALQSGQRSRHAAAGARAKRCRASATPTRRRSNARSTLPKTTSRRWQTSFIPADRFPARSCTSPAPICRRAERLVVALAEDGEAEPPAALRYLNRLSDALFVWARWINDALGVPEHLWDPSSRPPS